MPDIKFKGLLEMIEIEYRSIIADYLKNKKQPDIKDKLEKAVKWIQDNKGLEPNQIDASLTVLIDPFFTIAEHKVNKLYMQCFNIIQRLIMTVKVKVNEPSNEFQMSWDSRERILYFFSTITASDETLEEMAQIKILQIVMIFLDPNQSDKISKKFVNLVLKTCFQMFETKNEKKPGEHHAFANVMVKNTLTACINQLFTIVFELFIDKTKEVVGKDVLEQAFERENGQFQTVSPHFEKNLEFFQANLIFQVVEEIIQNLATALFIHEQSNKFEPQKKQTSIIGQISNQHIWNFKPSCNTKCALLEILCVILDQTKSIFIYFVKISRIFEKQIIPTISQMLQNIQTGQIDTYQGTRICKAAIMVINLLNCLKEDDLDESNSSSSSSKRQAPSLNDEVQRPLHIVGLDQLLINFAQMADYDQVVGSLKEKEITSQNVQQVFLKLTWKHLIGLECLAISFANQGVLKSLQETTLQQTLEVLSKDAHLLILLAHRNFMINMHSKVDDQFQNLETLSQQMVGGNQIGGYSRVAKDQVIMVCKQDQISEDDTLKCYLNPFHFEKLLQECVTGLIHNSEKFSAQNCASIAEILQSLGLSVQCNTTFDQESHQFSMLLNSYSSIISMLHSQKVPQRDILVKALCSLCLSSETLAKQGTYTSVSFNTGVCTLTNSLATETLADLVEHLLQSKRRNDQDLNMWTQIVETILRIDLVNRDKEKSDNLIDFTKIQRKALQNQRDLDQETDQTPKVSHFQGYNSVVVQSTPVILEKPKLQKTWTLQGAGNQTYEIGPLKLSKVKGSNDLADLIPFQSLISQDSKKINDCLDRVFIQTQFADKHTLSLFCGAFSRLLSECVTQSLKQPNIDQELTEDSLSIQLIKRLMEFMHINIQQIHLFWEQFLAMSTTFLQNQKSQVFKRLAIEANQSIIQHYFQYKKMNRKQKSPIKQFSQIDQLQGDTEIDSQPEDFDSSSDSLSITESQDLWSGNKWQSTILQPLSAFMLSLSVNDKLMTLRAIEKIIQLCGQSIKNDGWSVIIINVGKASEIGDYTIPSSSKNDEQQILQNGFKCLKLIISNYIQQLGQENFVNIFNCIQRFAQSDNENINSNLTAIAMFMNVADYTAKLTKEQQDQNRVSETTNKKINIDYIWQNLFQRMQSIGREYKAEIRRSLIQTLENIIINHGLIFSSDVWALLLQKILVPMLKHSCENFHKSFSRDNGESRRKEAFDDDTVMKALKEHDDQSYMETCSQLISSIYRSIKMYLRINSDSEILPAIWKDFHTILCTLISFEEAVKTISPLIIQVYRSQEDFLDTDTCNQFYNLHYKNQAELFTCTKTWVNREVNMIGDLKSRTKCQLLKVSPQIIRTLEKINQPDSVLELIESLLQGLKQISMKFQQYGKKLLAEEIQILKYLESLGKNIDHVDEYSEFMLEMLTYKQDNGHSESVVRYVIPIINSLIISGKPIPIQKYLDKVRELIALRYKWQVAKHLPIDYFEFVAKQLMLVCAYTISPDGFKKRMQQESTQETGMTYVGDISLDTNQENQKEVWNNIFDALTRDVIFDFEQFEQNDDGLQSQDEATFIEIIKISQNLDMQAMNFVVNDLLPYCTDIEMEQKLIKIVDNGCSMSGFKTSSSKFLGSSRVLQNFANNTSLSKYCLFNLFQICKFGLEDTEDATLSQMKQRIANQTTPILISRCSEILVQYSKDESRSGSIALPQNRISEVVFILKEIMALSEIKSNLLVQLMPILSEMIVSESKEVRELLRTIFRNISSQINI